MISAFHCDHCGFKNSEVSFAGKLDDFGVKYELKVINNISFNRTVVKSEYATIRVPEVGLEIPPQTQKGSIKTVEGFFMSTIEGLKDLQEERRKFDPVTADKIDEYCDKLKKYAEGEVLPFTFILEDPSGNSYIQNPAAPTADQYCKRTYWIRSAAEYEAMGYPVDQATLIAEQDKAKSEQLAEANASQQSGRYIGRDKRMVAQTKDEQEALLQKASQHATKIENKAAT